MKTLSQYERDQAHIIGKLVGSELKALDAKIAQLQTEIAQLKERLTEVEARGVKYEGVFQRAVSYRRGAVVSFKNCLFAAIVDTQPGDEPLSSKAWQLCLKGFQEPRRTTGQRGESS